LLKYFYDRALAHASYLVGCQQTSEAIVIDPARDIEEYMRTASAEGLHIVGAAETHIHADFVSGSRELAERTGATLYLSDAGPHEWKYAYAKQYPHQLLNDGHFFYVGKVRLTAQHTPGHTPEHLSFLLTDEGSGATEPLGLFSGDFVFVNAVGRPDLLETAAGVKGSAAAGARDLFHSVQKFKQLPDHLQVWPAHGAGSACGKGLGAIPSSTVGYEKLYNPALQFTDEQNFIDYILDSQPETPPYFKIMKRVNKLGPQLLSDHPVSEELDVAELDPVLTSGGQVIDTRDHRFYAAAHVPGTRLIPISQLGNWAGWLVDYEKPVYLIVSQNQQQSAIRILQQIGIDDLRGTFDPAAIDRAGLNTQSFRQAAPREVCDRIADQELELWDVRRNSEWNASHITHARHQFLGNLEDRIHSLNNQKPIVLLCRTGIRSAMAASLLQAAGIEQVINLEGGIMAWKAAGLPVTSGEQEKVTA